MTWVTVFTAFNPAEAQLICSRLLAANFEAQVVHELSALSLDGYALAAGGILVQVRDDQAADARALIDSAETGEAPNPE